MDPDACMERALTAFTDGEYGEMTDALEDYGRWLERGGFAGEEAPDIAEALYWVCEEENSGQGCPLYAALCANPFRPGPLASGTESGTLAETIYKDLTRGLV